MELEPVEIDVDELGKKGKKGEEEKVNPSLFLHPEVWQGFVTAIFQLASWPPGARL